MVAAAVCLILGQGIVVWLLAKFLKSFGKYTEQLVAIHATNIQIIEKQELLTEDLERLRRAS